MSAIPEEALYVYFILKKFILKIYSKKINKIFNNSQKKPLLI